MWCGSPCILSMNSCDEPREMRNYYLLSFSKPFMIKTWCHKPLICENVNDKHPILKVWNAHSLQWYRDKCCIHCKSPLLKYCTMNYLCSRLVEVVRILDNAVLQWNKKINYFRTQRYKGSDQLQSLKHLRSTTSGQSVAFS